MQRRNIRSRLRVGILALTAALAGSNAGSARADEPPYFAIRNARIVPVAGPVVEAGTVVISS